MKHKSIREILTRIYSCETRSKMEMTSLKFEDPLDGASNFLAWKARVILPQKQNDFWEIMDKGIQSPTDPT